MEIEAYSDYDSMISNSTPAYGHWMGYQVEVERRDGIAHLFKAYPMQGWANIKNTVKPMNASAQASGRYEWGDPDGGKFTVSGSASASNDKGDYVEVTVSQDSDGKGSIEVSAGTGTGNDKEAEQASGKK